jgi:hypothetical protein
MSKQVDRLNKAIERIEQKGPKNASREDWKEWRNASRDIGRKR